MQNSYIQILHQHILSSVAITCTSATTNNMAPSWSSPKVYIAPSRNGSETPQIPRARAGNVLILRTALRNRRSRPGLRTEHRSLFNKREIETSFPASRMKDEERNDSGPGWTTSR